VLVVYGVHSANRQLQEAFAQADRLDSGWRMTELQAKRAVVPDAQNAALVVLGAKNHMPPTPWPSGPFNAEDRNAISQMEPPVQLGERQTKVLREELGPVEQVLTLLHQLRDMPTGRYPKPMSFATLEMGKVLGHEAVLRAQDADLDGALASCHCILNCGRSSGDEPGFMPPLVRVALNQIATRKVERTLAQGEASDAALASIQHELAQEMEHPLFLLAARGARAELDEQMQAVENGNLDPRTVVHSSDWTGWRQQVSFVPGVMKGTRAALLKSNNALVEVAKLPVEEQVVRVKQLQANDQQIPAVFGIDRVCAQLRGMLATYGPYNKADLRCAVVMVAVERFRQAHQRWPDALTNLVPRFLAQVPLDPFDAAPLRYARREDGVVIYSIGPDGQDNGGMLDTNPDKVGTDVGFRLWSITKRRQLPKPAD
jgi:hypothetical protein